MPEQPHPVADVRTISTAELTSAEVAAIRSLLWAAFERPDEPDEAFTEDDWQHALGGAHVVVEVDGEIVAHAAVVERPIEFGGRRLRTGYVEAVATHPDFQGRGYGRLAMRAANDIVARDFEIGMLGTGEHGFYERLGWSSWRGRSYLRMDGGLVATPDDDGYLMILRTLGTPPNLDLEAAVSCDARPGDVW
ncbi:MAG: GNAT family N-acetyltransferase [Chloroflexota bacterium]|nr:MAG: GNAT family N-acetyltransferase [Chloroflexota bacterium]